MEHDMKPRQLTVSLMVIVIILGVGIFATFYKESETHPPPQQQNKIEEDYQRIADEIRRRDDEGIRHIDPRENYF
jgi:hypothetical protein